MLRVKNVGFAVMMLATAGMVAALVQSQGIPAAQMAYAQERNWRKASDEV
jgi:hypothetical protein